MATDLHTNLILNDSRFQQGLQDASSSAGRFFTRMSEGMQTVNQAAQGYRKMVAVAQDITNAWSRALEIQQRLNQGVASYREQWEAAHGWMAQVAQASATGRLGLDIAFNAQNGQLIESEMAIRKEILQRSAAREQELAVMRQSTDDAKEMIRLEQVHNAEIRRLQKLDRVSRFDYSGEIRQAVEHKRIAMEELRIRQEKTKAAKEAAEAARQESEAEERRRQARDRESSRFNFNERIFDDETKLIRARGNEYEADKRDIEAETRRRLAEVLDDPMLDKDPAELERRMMEVYRISNEKMAALNANPTPTNEYDRGRGVSASDGSTLGQVFGMTMNLSTALARKQADAAERSAKENARQTEILKSIDRGIQRVGTRYAS